MAYHRPQSLTLQRKATSPSLFWTGETTSSPFWAQRQDWGFILGRQPRMGSRKNILRINSEQNQLICTFSKTKGTHMFNVNPNIQDHYKHARLFPFLWPKVASQYLLWGTKFPCGASNRTNLYSTVCHFGTHLPARSGPHCDVLSLSGAWDSSNAVLHFPPLPHPSTCNLLSVTSVALWMQCALFLPRSLLYPSEQLH